MGELWLNGLRKPIDAQQDAGCEIANRLRIEVVDFGGIEGLRVVANGPCQLAGQALLGIGRAVGSGQPSEVDRALAELRIVYEVSPDDLVAEHLRQAEVELEDAVAVAGEFEVHKIRWILA